MTSQDKHVLCDDLLLHITDILPSEELARINSVNSVFHSEHLKRQYATVRFNKRDKRAKRLLLHLADQQAGVAAWVKRVEMQPWLVQPRTKSPRSLTENIIIQFMRLLDPHYTKKIAEQRLQKRLTKDVDRTVAAFTVMRNLKEYALCWDDNPQYHPELYKAFVVPVLNMWKAQLVKLTLKVPPPFLNSLAGISLPKLETFCFTFSMGQLSTSDVENTLSGFVVFVNNTGPTLCSLSLVSTRSSEHFDMSRIFRFLGKFPLLRRVSISIPYDGGHLLEPANFVDFLERNRQQLRELNLFTNLLTVGKEQGHPMRIEWVQRILASIHTPFPCLRSLGIALRPMRRELDTVRQFVDIHVPTLNSLRLMDRSLTEEDFHSLVNTRGYLLAEALVHLYIKVDELSAPLLAGIAGRCPNLENLQIECNRITGYRASGRAADGKSLISEFSAYLDQPEAKAAMEAWKLQKLAISLPNFSGVKTIEPDLLGHLPDLAVVDLMTTPLPYGQFIY